MRPRLAPEYRVTEHKVKLLLITWVKLTEPLVVPRSACTGIVAPLPLVLTADSPDADSEAVFLLPETSTHACALRLKPPWRYQANGAVVTPGMRGGGGGVGGEGGGEGGGGEGGGGNGGGGDNGGEGGGAGGIGGKGGGDGGGADGGPIATDTRTFWMPQASFVAPSLIEVSTLTTTLTAERGNITSIGTFVSRQLAERLLPHICVP